VIAIRTDVNRELLTVIATFRAGPGKEEELRELASPHITDLSARLGDLVEGEVVVTRMRRVG